MSQTVLRMIGPEDVGGAWSTVIEQFQKHHPSLRIDYVSGPWSTDERQSMYVRSFLAGNPFELVYMDVTWTAKFAEKGWILPLDHWFSRQRQGQFFPGDIEAGVYEGHVYRVPVTSDVGVLYYRRDLIPVPPATWEEFEQICERRSNPPERYCIVFQGMQYEGLV